MIFQTEDAKEGPKAFAEKRQPNWQGEVTWRDGRSRARRASSASAQRTWHPGRTSATQGAPEPLEMWDEVAAPRRRRQRRRRASVLAALDSIADRVLPDWQYDDPVARLADAARRRPEHRHYSGIGGTTPQLLVNATAATRCSRGELDLALVTGAEALATQARAARSAASGTAYRFRPAEKRRSRGRRRSTRSRSRTRCSRRG